MIHDGLALDHTQGHARDPDPELAAARKGNDLRIGNGGTIGGAMHMGETVTGEMSTI